MVVNKEARVDRDAQGIGAVSAMINHRFFRHPAIGTTRGYAKKKMRLVVLDHPKVIIPNQGGYPAW